MTGFFVWLIVNPLKWLIGHLFWIPKIILLICMLAPIALFAEGEMPANAALVVLGGLVVLFVILDFAQKQLLKPKKRRRKPKTYWPDDEVPL